MINFTRLQYYPTEQFSEDITFFHVDMFNWQVINKHTFEFLRPRDAITSQFYILPKLHKVGIPRRPIISSCSSPTEKISLFVDYYLNPLDRIPSFIKDTNDFLCKLQSLTIVPFGSLLVTLDVSSVYTNIPDDEGWEACREALNTREDLSTPTEDIINLMSFILIKIISFLMTSIICRSIELRWGLGWPRCMQTFYGEARERDLLNYTTNTPSIWWRYIDKIFAVWPHGERNLQIFWNELNSFHATIKFTTKWSREPVMFLDTRITNNEGCLMTDLYTKPTDTHQYLHPDSCHPSHCKKSIA